MARQQCRFHEHPGLCIWCVDTAATRAARREMGLVMYASAAERPPKVHTLHAVAPPTVRSRPAGPVPINIEAVARRLPRTLTFPGLQQAIAVLRPLTAAQRAAVLEQSLYTSTERLGLKLEMDHGPRP